MRTLAMRRNNRKAMGSTIAEIGPVLFVLLFFIFFPLLDMTGMVASYTACMALNQLQLREAAISPPVKAQDPTGSVRKNIPDQWMNSALGRFVSPVEPPQTEVTYRKVAGLKNDIVIVTTRVKAKPMITVPLMSDVPGLGAPVQFTFATERLVENVAL